MPPQTESLTMERPLLSNPAFNYCLFRRNNFELWKMQPEFLRIRDELLRLMIPWDISCSMLEYILILRIPRQSHPSHKIYCRKKPDIKCPEGNANGERNQNIIVNL